MIEIKDKTIAFKADGTLVIFDTRDEFAEWERNNTDYMAFAEPRYLLYELREQEAIISRDESENTVTSLDDLDYYNLMQREGKKEDAESEIHLRAKIAREDGTQRKLWEHTKNEST